LEATKNTEFTEPEDRDEYSAVNIDETVNVDDVQYVPKSIAERTKEFWLNTGDLPLSATPFFPN